MKTKKRRYTKRLLASLASASRSIREMLRKLSLTYSGGNHAHIRSRLKEYKIDTSHFTGQAWSRGKTLADASVTAYAAKNSYSNEEVFVENSPLTKGEALVRRLRRLGWEYKCSICSLDQWLNKPITLHLDHKSGNRSDNRLENLRFLCPNCHQQTDTWGAKNARRGKSR